MDEDVGPFFPPEEAVAFCVIKPFHGAFVLRHVIFLLFCLWTNLIALNTTTHLLALRPDKYVSLVTGADSVGLPDAVGEPATGRSLGRGRQTEVEMRWKKDARPWEVFSR
jgi:hypothetical protein